MVNIIPIQAFKDNYIWLLVNSANKCCLIFDPGDAKPVLAYLQTTKLIPSAILITHHHHDHTGGIEKLIAAYPLLPVYGPATEKIAHLQYPLRENDHIAFANIGAEFRVIDIPGHTSGHIAYFGNDALFCGDTLFSAGCGRVFEGTPEQMYASLCKLADLPDDTAVYCAHEYTENNLRFAKTVEPDNQAIKAHLQDVEALRTKHQPTLPSTIGLEKQINPFLRCHNKNMLNSLREKLPQNVTNPITIFTILRKWKDDF